MRITFAEQFGKAAQARISAALHRARTADEPGSAPGPSAWAPEHIHVERQFAGGLSGAAVIGLRAKTAGAWTRHVAKLAPAEEAHDELQAFLRIFSQLPHMLFVPIRTATPGAHDPDTAQELEPDEAVVYVDVATWAGCEPDQEVLSLEQLAERAVAPGGTVGDVEHAEDALDRLLGLASLAMYQGAAPRRDPDDRMAAKRSLGPDMTVVVNGVDAKGQPVYGTPGQDTLRAHLVAPLDVIRAGLAPPEEEGVLTPGGLVTLTVPGARATAGGLLVERDNAVVAVEFEPGGDAALRGLDPEKVRYVHGRVTDTRPHRARRRIAAALGALGDTPGVVRVGGTRARDPYALLEHVVRERTAATLVGVVHGDLNHRNILFCDGRPFLIDYARGRRDMPVLDDLAWLELNLLRRPLADGLSFDDLVAVERVLLLGDLVADLLPPGPDGLGVLGERLAGLVAHRGRHAVAAIRLLSVLRARVRRTCAGKDTGHPWWSEYQVALLLAAHRAFKWPDDLQTKASWRAQVASACVATEALEHGEHGGHGGPFLRLWGGSELAAAARALLPLLPDEPDPRAAGLLAAVVDGLRTEAGTGPADALRGCRTGVARAVAGPATHRRLRELDEERKTRTPFIDLAAAVAGPSPGPGPRRRTWSEAPSAVEEVLATSYALVLGGVGSGRTTLLDEVERRRLTALQNAGGTSGAAPGLLPVRLAGAVIARCADADALEQQIGAVLEAVAPGADRTNLLRAGVVHLLVDLPRGTEPPTSAGILRDFTRRWPAVGVTAAAPGPEPTAEYDAYTAVRLLGPRPEQAARYLARRSAQRGLGPEHAAELTDLALSDTWAELLREGRCSPLLLARLAHWPVGGPARRRPGNEHEVLHAYFTEVTADWPGPVLLHVKARATHLTDPEEEPRGGRELPEDMRAVPVDSGVLTAEGAFHRVEDREYFAFRWLRSRDHDRALLRRLALRHRWYGAFRRLAALTRSPEELLPRLVEELAEADPVQAAALLGAPTRPPRRPVEAFLRRQATVLADRRAGELEHRAAAFALAAFDAPVAYRHLFTALADPDGPPTAQAAALRALVTAARTTRQAAYGHRVSEELAQLLAPLLTPDTRQALTLPALHAVETLTLRRLALCTADLVRPGMPWPVVRAALAALDALDVSQPAALAKARQAAEREGLAYVERALDGPVSGGDAAALAVERVRLVRRLPGPERVRTLLERRFAPGMGELCGELLEEHVRSVPRPETAARYEDVLWRRGEPDSAHEMLRTTTDGLCRTAALHRLLLDAPERGADAFALLSGPDSPAGAGLPERAGPVAATVRSLPAELLARAELFGVRAAEACDPDCSLDGIAALADAVRARDRQAGLRLARRAHRHFAAGGLPARLRGAWAATLIRCSADADTVTALLSSPDPDDQDLALDVLADHGLLLLAGPVRARVAEGSEARIAEGVLKRLRTAGPADVPRLARASAVLGLVDALPLLCDRIERYDGADPAVPVSFGALGVWEVPPFADLLAATGYLAARAGAGHPDAVRAYCAARDFDTSGAHPGVALGRLAALAVAGDWPPVLNALPGEDPRLPVIAGNALAHWLPGPFTPAGADASEAARRVADRLAQDATLPPEARSHLYGLRTTLERRTGTATVARPAHTPL
ncbi:hypothetical protein ACIRBZ_04040 [Streptomyces sp. NPDC094038]|uniref:hypothetical protein n=1 Tax=Streptomyces sp. NPDC094038 TaxID=3366055 RepID=UPI003804758C